MAIEVRGKKAGGGRYNGSPEKSWFKKEEWSIMSTMAGI